MDHLSTVALSPEETVSLLRAAASASLQERSLIEEQVVTAHLPLASRIAGRYRQRGIDLEDLRQVANMALVKAVRRFDPERGEFAAFAGATISGEVKKHFRDYGWMVRPPRSVQQLQVAIGEATERHVQIDGSVPTLDELASELDVGRDEVVDAAAARGCFNAASLDAPEFGEGRTLGDTVADESGDFDLVERWTDFRPAWDGLTDDEKQLIALRFFDDLTQDKIAAIVGVSQMQVSRRLKAVLAKIREAMSVQSAA